MSRQLLPPKRRPYCGCRVTRSTAVGAHTCLWGPLGAGSLSPLPRPPDIPQGLLSKMRQAPCTPSLPAPQGSPSNSLLPFGGPEYDLGAEGQRFTSLPSSATATACGLIPASSFRNFPKCLHRGLSQGVGISHHLAPWCEHKLLWGPPHTHVLQLMGLLVPESGRPALVVGTGPASGSHLALLPGLGLWSQCPPSTHAYFPSCCPGGHPCHVASFPSLTHLVGLEEKGQADPVLRGHRRLAPDCSWAPSTWPWCPVLPGLLPRLCRGFPRGHSSPARNPGRLSCFSLLSGLCVPLGPAPMFGCSQLIYQNLQQGLAQTRHSGPGMERKKEGPFSVLFLSDVWQLLN